MMVRIKVKGMIDSGKIELQKGVIRGFSHATHKLPFGGTVELCRLKVATCDDKEYSVSTPREPCAIAEQIPLLQDVN